MVSMKVMDIMTREGLVTLPATAKVTDAFAKMKETGIHQIPVLSGKTYTGMLLFRELLKRRSLQSMEKIGSLAIRTPRLKPSDDIYRAIDLIRKSGIPALPVAEKGMLVGILSRTDIMRNLGTFSDIRNMKVLDVMTSSPETVNMEDSIKTAMEKMRSLDESEIPVTDADLLLKGILSAGEISPSAIIKGEQTKGKGDISGETSRMDLKCSSMMGNPISVHPESTLEDASRALLKNRFHTLPVTDIQGKVVGVIGIMDILNMISVPAREKGILIQVSGLDAYDDDLYDIIFFEGEKFVSRISRIAGIENGSFNIHVTKYHSSGKVKYSLRTRLYGGHIHMAVDDFDWNFGKCLSRIFDTYENRLKKNNSS